MVVAVIVGLLLTGGSLRLILSPFMSSNSRLNSLSFLPVYPLGVLPHVEHKLEHAGVFELTHLHLVHLICQLQQTLMVNSDIASHQESTL